MSNYGGGVAVSVVTALKNDINTGIFCAGQINMVGVSSASYTSGSPSFWTELNAGNGYGSIVPPDISGGYDLVDVAGKGFVNAIIIPAFALSSGSFTLTITKDGVTEEKTFLCANIHNALVFSAETYIRSLNADGYYTQAVTISSLCEGITAGESIRFEQNLKITITSATAVSTGDPAKYGGVAFKGDYV